MASVTHQSNDASNQTSDEQKHLQANSNQKIWEGANALVTGANRGIGLALMRRLAAFRPPLSNLFAACRDPNAAIV